MVNQPHELRSFAEVIFTEGNQQELAAIGWRIPGRICVGLASCFELTVSK